MMMKRTPLCAYQVAEDPTPSFKTTILRSLGLWLFLSALGLGAESACAQTTIANYDFNSGVSYTGQTPSLATGITSAMSSTELFNIVAGTTTGSNAFTANTTAGTAVSMSNSNGTNSRYYQFDLGGQALSSYSAFRIYFQAQRSSTGAQIITVQYSLNGALYTDFTSNTMAPGNGVFTEGVFTLPTAINYPSASLSFRLLASGASGSGTLRVDNVQIRATATAPSITASASLTAFATTYGIASGVQSFAVSGANLTTAITATAPNGFEVSSDGTNFAAVTTFAQSGGSANGTLTVRLKPNAPVGTYNAQNIVFTSPGAATVNVPTSATGNTVSAAALTISGVSATSKVYDGTTAAELTGTATYVGLVNGETFAVTGTPVGTFATKNVGTGIAVTVSGYTAPSANYTVTPPSGLAAEITPKPVTITANNVTKLFGTALVPVTGSTAFSSSALAVSETIGTVTIAYGSGAAATDPVGTYAGSVTASAPTGGTFDPANYAMTYVAGDLTVRPRPEISTSGAAGAVDTTYGTASPMPGSFHVSGANLLGDITATPPSGYEMSTTAGSGYAPSVTLPQSGGVVPDTTLYLRLTATATAGTYAGNIALTSADATPVSIALTTSRVSPKPLTIDGVTGVTKVYDRTTAATLSGSPALTGLVGSDSLNVTGTPVATFASRNVGTGIPIAVTGYSLSGAATSNYTLTQPGTLTAEITARPLTVPDAQVMTKAYDGNATAAITGTLTGVVSGDVVTITLAGAFAQVTPGTGIAVTSTSEIAGADHANYHLVPLTGLTGTITRASQTITFNELATAAYGDADLALTASASSALPVSYASSNPSVATVTGSTVHVIGAGTTTITASQAGDGTYEAAAAVAHILTVNPAVLTITAKDVTKPYGTVLSGSANSIEFSAMGLVGADAVSSVAIAYGSGAAESDAPGTYHGSVVASAATGTFSPTNYTVLYVAGSITVMAVPTIATSGTPTGVTCTYGNAQAGTVTGFDVSGSQLTGDLIVTAPIGFAVSTAAGSGFSSSLTLSATDGTVAVTAIYVRLASTNSVGIYSGDVTVSGGGAPLKLVSIPTSSVSAKALTLSGLNGVSKVYDRTTTGSISGTPVLSGVIGSDEVSVTGTATVTFATAAAGSEIPLTVSGYTLTGSAASNYTLTQPSGLAATITSKPLTIANASVIPKSYDGTTSATLAGTLSGVIDPDDVSLEGTGLFASAGPGSGIAVTSTSTLNGADAGNYSLTQPVGLSGTILASSNAELAGLVLSTGSLNPAFSPSVYAYSVAIPVPPAQVNLTPTTADANATVRINGDLVASSVPVAVPLTLGANTVTILVTAADHTTSRLYTLSLNIGGDGGTFDFAAGAIAANPVDRLGAPTVVTVSINRTGALGGDVDVAVTPGLATGLPKGQTPLVNGTDYLFSDPTVVHFHDGESAKTASVTLKSGVRAGAFTLNLVSASAPGELGITRKVTITVNSKDVTAPTLTLNAVPVTVASAMLTISGTVKDGGTVATGVSKVELAVTNITGAHAAQSLDLAAILPATTPPSFTFTGDVALENGLNTLTITAYDGAGNKLTKTAKVIFNDGAISALASTYSGLLLPQGAASNDSLGYLTVTATSATMVSGKLTVGGATISFAGALDSEGDVHFKAAGNPITLDIVDKTDYEAYLGALSLHIEQGAATGTLKDSAGGSTLAVAQALPQASANEHLLDSSRLAQKYTVRFPSLAQTGLTAAQSPQGDSYALLTVFPSGAVSATGMLADGTVYSGAGRLNAADDTGQSVALHTNLYRRAGAFALALNFALDADSNAVTISDLTATEGFWIRPNLPRARYYKAGWPSGLTVTAEGGRWSAPPSGESLLPGLAGTPPNARLRLGDGSLREVNISPTNLATNASSDPAVKLGLSAALGTFKGWVTYGGSAVAYQGIIIREGPNPGGAGYLLTPAPSSYSGAGESLSLALEPKP